MFSSLSFAVSDNTDAQEDASNRCQRLFSGLDFTCTPDSDAQEDASNRCQRLFSGLDFTCTDSDAQDDAAQQSTLNSVSNSTSPSVLSTTKPAHRVAFRRKRTLQQAKLRWAKPLISAIMPNASRPQVQQLNELLQSIKTPDGLQKLQQAIKLQQHKQECSKICNALKTTLTQGKTEDTRANQRTVVQLIKRGIHKHQ
jgi:hypothetical protein